MLTKSAFVACVVAFGGAHASAQTLQAVQARNEPHHHLAYEDSVLRVLRVRVAPHDTTLIHQHDADYFWISLGASRIVNAKVGAPDATVESGDLSIHYTPGHFAHAAINLADMPFDNITVELLQPQTNPRNRCDAAIAGAPLDCPVSLRRPPTMAVERPAFATDQLLVDLVTIQAHGVFEPRQARNSWIIVLDTTNVNTRLVALGTTPWRGGVTFLPGDALLRNRGDSAVKALYVRTVGGEKRPGRP